MPLPDLAGVCLCWCSSEAEGPAGVGAGWHLWKPWRACCDSSNAETSICESLENNNLDNQRLKPCGHKVTMRSSSHYSTNASSKRLWVMNQGPSTGQKDPWWRGECCFSSWASSMWPVEGTLDIATDLLGVELWTSRGGRSGLKDKYWSWKLCRVFQPRKNELLNLPLREEKCTCSWHSLAYKIGTEISPDLEVVGITWEHM